MVESYISIDLNDPRMKHLSEVFGNESCKKILNLLAEKELTETDISKELKMPLNSVDYNIKKLVRAGLIESGSHWWSVKGKKMPSYRVSNKKIVISPRRISSSFIVPLVMTVVVGFLGVSKYLGSVAERSLTRGIIQTPVADVAVNEVSLKTMGAVNEIAGAASIFNDSTLQVASNAGFFASLSSFEWLMIGIWIGSVLFFVLNYIFYKRGK